MKELIAKEFVTFGIDEKGNKRFETFLDRNFGNWRLREIHREKNNGTIIREWFVGIDGIERKAIFRKDYVELFDRYIDLDQREEARIHFLPSRICDIAGDYTPVATWKR